MIDNKALGFSIAAEIRLKHGKLYAWLKEKGLTNVDLGRMAGIHHATIGLYINMKLVPGKQSNVVIRDCFPVATAIAIIFFSGR